MQESEEHPKVPLLKVRDLCKFFPVHSKGIRRKVIDVVKAVDHVSFDIQSGETLGLVGESGSGKTTCARTILRALDPTSGNVHYHDDEVQVELSTISERGLKPLRQRMQMIFQDPFSSLNPRMTVGSIVEEPLLVHNIGTKSERRDMVAEILEKVGLEPNHRERYPHAFSGGQRQRIGIARALVLRPRFVVCDEAVSALDVSVQAQVINLLMDLQEEFKLTYLFVAHDLGVVRHICDRIAVMRKGKLVELDTTDNLFDNPRHPYTQRLLSAIPHPDPDVPLAPIPEDPSIGN